MTRNPAGHLRASPLPSARPDVSRRTVLRGTVGAGAALAVGSALVPSAGAEVTPPTVRLLRNVNAGDPSTAGSERWQYQVLQGDRKRPSTDRVGEQLVYSTAVLRRSDPSGVTQCVRPADVRDEWVLRDASGRPIHRGINGDGGDYALDVGNVELQRASAEFLVAKCRGTSGQPWTGVHLDEVNASFGWGWSGAVPGRYRTDDQWKDALAGFVDVLGRRLDGAGFTLVGNLGAATSATHDAWFEALVGSGMVPNLEYFVCGEKVAGTSTANYASPEEWLRQVELVETAETSRSPRAVTPRGTRIVVHDRQDTEAGIRYSLASFLMATSGSGSSVYGADVGYDASTTPYPACYTDAQRLGRPTGARTNVAADLWGRYFARGYVLVNPGLRSTTYSGVTVGPRSALITVTS